MPTIKAMHITVVDHPLAASRLTLMRDERSDNATFRAALADLGTMLIYEASRHLDVEHFDTKTPVGIAQGTRLKNPPIIVPVIRAGLGMVDPALSMIPDAQVGFIGLARNEQTHEPVPYLEALPETLAGQTVVVVDPMLATGGSLLVRLVTATIDPQLNDDAYIVPGLGDAGDRLYGPRNIDL